MNHYALLHTKIELLGFMASEFFLKFVEAKNAQWVAHLNPRDMVGKIYVGDHQTLQYTKD